MNMLLLIVRFLLALIFGIAGLAKLADLPGSRQALIDFGMPTRLSGLLGVLLPLTEIAVAVALIPSFSGWWGAIGALTLLLLFVAGVGYNLARGRQPDCHCLGRLYSAPIGWPTLIRNLILAAFAALVVVFGPKYVDPNVLGWLAALAPIQRFEFFGGIIMAGLLIGEGWLLWLILRQQGRLLLRIEAMESQQAARSTAPQPAPVAAAPAPKLGLPVGSPAPAFVLSGLYAETLTLDAIRSSGKPTVLIFSDPGCGPCSTLLPEVGRWQHEYERKLNLVLISRGTPEANRAKVTEHGITRVLLQQDREVTEAYQVRGTPGAVLVRPDGTIGSQAAMGPDAIRELVAGAAGLPVLKSLPMVAAKGNGNGGTVTAGQRVTLKRGEQAPAFTLPDLSGRSTSLADFRGHTTILLFWNPGCGFCQRMLEDLKAWEAQPPADAPRLLIVSTGKVEANEALGLRSPILLDQGMSVGSKFGATGTPMALLIDAEGKIASEVAAGASAVMALAAPERDNSALV